MVLKYLYLKRIYAYEKKLYKRIRKYSKFTK